MKLETICFILKKNFGGSFEVEEDYCIYYLLGSSYRFEFENIIKEKPDLLFYVTEIGCGLAGYTYENIAPLFYHSYKLPNVYMPKRFWEVYQTLTKRL